VSKPDFKRWYAEAGMTVEQYEKTQVGKLLPEVGRNNVSELENSWLAFYPLSIPSPAGAGGTGSRYAHVWRSHPHHYPLPLGGRKNNLTSCTKNSFVLWSIPLCCHHCSRASDVDGGFEILLTRRPPGMAFSVAVFRGTVPKRLHARDGALCGYLETCAAILGNRHDRARDGPLDRRRQNCLRRFSSTPIWERH
jgi:hypothetical protein